MLWLAAVALAQEPGSSVCSRAIGGVAGVTFGRRDYDFTTPGLYATSQSPVLSQTCTRIGKSAGASQMAFWLGFDAMPLLVHSYGRFGERSPVWVEAALGAGRRYGRHIVGLQLITNSVIVGVGARWVVRLPEKADHGAPSLEVKMGFYPAHDPEVRATVVLHFASAHFDPRRNPMTPMGRRPASEPPPEPPPPTEAVPWPETPDWPDHWDETASAPEDVPWDAQPSPLDPVPPPEPPPEPPPADEPVDRGEPPVRVTAGFEVGSMMGLRGDVAWMKHGTVGLRVGSLTAFRADSLLQPTGLLIVGASFGPAVSVGVTRHDNVWTPVGGAAFVIGGTARMRLHLGALFGREFLAPDLSTVVLW